MAEPVRVIRMSPEGDPVSGMSAWEPISRDSVLSGQADERRHRFYMSDRKLPGQIRVGVWEAGAYCEKLVNYPKDEFMYVIEGSVTIIAENGHKEKFEKGDSFFMPAGFSGVWFQDEPMKKYFMVFDPHDSGD